MPEQCAREQENRALLPVTKPQAQDCPCRARNTFLQQGGKDLAFWVFACPPPHGVNPAHFCQLRPIFVRNSESFKEMPA